MFPEKTFYNHNKLAFLVPLCEILSPAFNKWNDDDCLILFQRRREMTL